MKKICIVLVAVIGLLISTESKAQLLVGGSLDFGYASKGFVFHPTGMVVYELKDMWAAMGQAGFGFQTYGSGSNRSSFGLGAFARYTPWNNGILFLDFKGGLSFSNTSYGSDSVYQTMFIGIIPSARFRVAPRWEMFANFGTIGIENDSLGYGSWRPSLAIASSGALGVLFRL